VVHGGGGGFSGGPEADQVLSRAAKGGEHGVVCREGGAFVGWLGKGGVLGSDLWEASSLPALVGGTQQEAAWAQAIDGASRVSPFFSYPGRSLGMQVEALTMSLAVQEGELQWVREDHDVVQMEKEAMEWERNTSREDWLANAATSGHTGILRWVREHWVLLDGASAAFTLIQDGLAQGSMVRPPELQQGMARLVRLLAEHWRRNAVAPGSWWEVVADAGEALLGLAEVLA
ncbi:hypothetical protein C0989_005089, partial [Termitomyces sp. Mn162]